MSGKISMFGSVSPIHSEKVNPTEFPDSLFSESYTIVGAGMFSFDNSVARIISQKIKDGLTRRITFSSNKKGQEWSSGTKMIPIIAQAQKSNTLSGW